MQEKTGTGSMCCAPLTHHTHTHTHTPGTHTNQHTHTHTTQPPGTRTHQHKTPHTHTRHTHTPTHTLHTHTHTRVYNINGSTKTVAFLCHKYEALCATDVHHHCQMAVDSLQVQVCKETLSRQGSQQR